MSSLVNSRLLLSCTLSWYGMFGGLSSVFVRLCRTGLHAYARTCAREQTRTYMNTHTHTHPLSPSLPLSLSLSLPLSLSLSLSQVAACTTAGMPAGLTEDDEACFDAIKVCVCARARVLLRVREGTLQGG